MKTMMLWPSIAACTLLAACGGGSTSGGGGVGGTPTPPPAPTPSPSPTPTNTSLADLQFSETFTNDAASGNGTVRKSDGTGSATAARSTITVRYDAAARSYTITSGTRSQTFAPTDRSTAESNQFFNVYTKTNGSTQDGLSLTAPGNSGRLTYTYVGSGFWQRLVDSSSNVSLSVDAFTYGVETPASAVPRTGSAGYAIDLIANNDISTFTGTGQLTADFASGTINAAANVIDITGGSTFDYGDVFRANAQIASDQTFSGEFSMSVGADYSGTLDGRFYGPAAQEIGAAFGGKDDPNNNVEGRGDAIVGTITGRRDGAIAVPNSSLIQLDQDQQFSGYGSHVKYLVDGDDIFVSQLREAGAQLRYQASDSSFVINDYDAPAIKTEFGSADIVARNARYTVYELPGITTSDLRRLTLYNPGSENTQLALTYLSFGRLETVRTDFGRSVVDQVFLWGIETDRALLPRTGTARYDGIVAGTAIDNARSESYDLGGTGRFDVDFAGASVSATLGLSGVSDSNGSTRDFGQFVMPATAFNPPQLRNGVFLGFLGQGNAVNVGSIRGTFYGPGAAELGAAFHIDTSSFGTGNLAISGVTVAKRAP